MTTRKQPDTPVHYDDSITHCKRRRMNLENETKTKQIQTHKRLPREIRETLKLLALGLCDPNSSLYSFSHHQIFDRHLIIQIKSYLVDSFVFDTEHVHDNELFGGRPVALTIHQKSRRLFILSDYGCIQVLQLPRLTFISKFGSQGSGPLEFESPSDIVQHDSYLYVADTDNGRVQVATLEGEFVRDFGQGILDRPHGIACDSNNLIYVSNCVPYKELGAIIVFQQNGTVHSRIGYSGFNIGTFDNFLLGRIYHMCINPIAEELFALDYRFGNVLVYSTRTGNFCRRFMYGDSKNGIPKLHHPHGIALHGSNIIVADTSNKQLQVFDSRTGMWLKSYPPTRNQHHYIEINFPGGICVDAYDGSIYVCDTYEDQVHCLLNI